ncbi:MAG TPA: acyl-CoA-binding protein [Myxococcota bacterium]|nr:acyl-CoA-binding protein [Myxococcota bacterium]
MSDIKARFEAAIERSKDLPTQSPTTQLELYGLFKQASSGNATGSRPGMFDVRGRAKWDAWEKRKGMSADAAMEAYIELVDRLAE